MITDTFENLSEEIIKASCSDNAVKEDAYFFLTCGDLLDAPKWVARMKKNQIKHTQHDPRHFDIALEPARCITE